MVEAARAALTQAGHEVRVASDAGGALELVKARRFDLVLAEIPLAPASAVDLVRVLRQIAPPLAIILMTGYGNWELAAYVVRVGATGFLLKPFTTNEVRMAVEDAIDRPGHGQSHGPRPPELPADGIPEVFKRAWVGKLQPPGEVTAWGRRTPFQPDR
jgi:DNA-binding NtrC family response regulator